jgi:hypothetical protein
MQMKLFNERKMDFLSIEVAYFLGLIFSDGCICKTTQHRFLTCLGSVDKEIVKRFKKFMESKNSINKTTLKSGKISHKISLCSKYLYDILKNYGCSPRKSLILKAPVLPEKFYKPFLLGYFDGDGSISVNSSINSWKVSIGCGSKIFCIWLKRFIEKNKIIYGFETRSIKSGHFYNITFMGISAKFFLDILYNSFKDSSIKPLARKKNLYNVLCNVKFKSNPRFQEWEKEIIRKIKDDKKAAQEIISDHRNYGWTRPPESIHKLRKKII